ncbi:MAG: Ig-like domain-containing protein, partial [Kamptonema sp. SIO4C4]|nr:Ig-like domain-containing protein [Kamptonema sp. SIO4C4]
MKLKLNAILPWRQSTDSPQQWWPFDVAAIASIGGLTLVLLGILLVGDRSIPQVVGFSWQDQRIGVDDQSFTLQFNQPMDWESVQENLDISPPLPGKSSWVGRTFVYTLTDLPAYGTEYEMVLQGAENTPKSSRQT